MPQRLKHSLIVLMFLICETAHAWFGQDTLLLATLCSTTASQLAELTELLETQQKVTEQFTKVANAINEKIDFAERLQYHVEELMALQEVDVQDLGSLVDEVRRLKGTIVDTKEFIASLEEEVVGDKAKKVANNKERHKNMNKKRMAMRRANLPMTSSSKDIQLATAKTNAYMLDEEISSNNHLIDIKDYLLDMKDRDAKKELLTRAEGKRWEDYYGMNGYFESLARQKSRGNKRKWQ